MSSKNMDEEGCGDVSDVETADSSVHPLAIVNSKKLSARVDSCLVVMRPHKSSFRPCPREVC